MLETVFSYANDGRDLVTDLIISSGAASDLFSRVFKLRPEGPKFEAEGRKRGADDTVLYVELSMSNFIHRHFSFRTSLQSPHLILSQRMHVS